MLAQYSSGLTLTYTTQVRNSGSQVFVGKQERPRRARSGAPTCSHPHGGAAPTTCRLKSSPTVRALAEVREGETPEKQRIRPSQVHPAVPRKARLQFSIRSNHGKTSKCCIWLHVAPIRMSPWITDDDPLTKIDNAATFSRQWSHREPRNRSGKFSSKIKRHTVSISSHQRTLLLALS